MSLGSALATAMSGLSANQAALSIVSSNIANAQTPGYVTQNVNQVALSSGSFDTGVQVTGVSRELDLYVQNQLRTETSGGAYADQTSNILGQRHPRNGVQQFHNGVAGAIDQFGHSVRAGLGADGGAIARTATEYNDAGH